jgi:hypothetical protein
MTLDKNSSLLLLSTAPLLLAFPYLPDTLVTVNEKNPYLLAPAITILLPSQVTPRHPRDREGVQCNFSEGIQEHSEGEQQRERRGSTEVTEQQKGPKTVTNVSQPVA